MHSCNFIDMKTTFLRGDEGMAVTKGMIRILLILFFMLPMGAYALGLGDIKLRSSLEEPFDAEIELTSVSKSVLESLQVKLASGEDFARVGIKPVAAVKLLSFEIVKKPGGGAVIRITTPEPVHDPYLNFLIEANWGRGRVLREYTVLLDPPELAGEDAPFIEAPSVASIEPEVAAPPAVPDVPEPPSVMEPELSLVEDEGLIEPEIIEPEIIEPELLPEVAEPGLLEPETLPPVAEEGLVEPELSEVIEPEFKGSAELPIVETEPAIVASEQDAFLDVDDVAVGSEGAGEGFVPLFYSVERGDTLWSIAEQMRGDRSASVYQVMMALFDNNRSAFIGDNLNSLKSGAILRIEDEGELTAVSKATAKNEFWQQYRAWQDYKQMLAKNVATQGDAGSDAVPGAEAAESADEALTSAQEGVQLTLLGPDEVDSTAPGVETAGKVAGETTEGDGASISAKGIGELQVMRDEVLAEIEKGDAGSTQNQALREKLVALEEQIASLQRVVSVKDTELAALQQRSAESAVAQESDATATEAGADEGLMEKLNRSPQLMGIMGGAILLLLAWSWLMFRRRSEEKQAMATLVAAEDEAGRPDDEGVSRGGAVAVESTLSRVDAYVDAGKHAAAAEVLAEAIKREPDNEDYRYRLLDIHYEMKNKDGFSREADELYSSTHGSDAVRWGKVVAMGAALVPAHALFSSSPVFAEEDTLFDSALPAESGSVDEEMASGEWDDIDLDSELDGSSFKKNDEEQLIGEVLDDTPIEASGDAILGEAGQNSNEKLSDEAWDLDFQIDEADETSRTFLMEEEILGDGGSKPDIGGDIDFNLSEDGETKTFPGSDAGEEEESTAEGGDVLAFVPRKEDVVTISEAGQPATLEGLVAPEAEDAAQDLPPDYEEIAVEGGSELLELDDESEEQQPFPSFSEYDALAEDDELLDDVDEIGTKLDLAKAYIDMGDAEAARNILGEVKDEGDNVQKQEAAVLLGQISEAGGR